MNDRERLTSFGLYSLRGAERIDPAVFQRRLGEALADLNDALSLIAFDNKSEDAEYIAGKQQVTRDKYGELIDFLERAFGGWGISEWHLYLPTVVKEAYEGLQELDISSSPLKVQEEAENIVQGIIVPFFEPALQLGSQRVSPCSSAD